MQALRTAVEVVEIRRRGMVGQTGLLRCEGRRMNSSFEKMREQKKKRGNIFEKMGVFLVDLFKLDQPGKGKQRLQQELISLSRGGRAAVRSYCVRKVSATLAVLTAGVIITLVSFAVYLSGREDTGTEAIRRPGYGEGDRQEELTVQVDGGDTEQQLEITVQERKYTDREKQEILDRAIQKLDELLPGENESLDRVQSSLYLPESLEDGAVQLSWTTVPYGVIDDDGSLKEVEDEAGTLVEIQGTLTCSGKEASYTAYAKVFPPDLPEQERLRRSIQRQVELADAGESHEEELRLPRTVEGKTLTWHKVSENPAPAAFILTLMLAAAVYLEMDSQVHQKAEQRRNQLMLAYPDLMWKMTMLLGAGLSIKGTFSRISEEYQRSKALRPKARGRQGQSKKEQVNYAYEEILDTCFEMQSGIPEGQAYERFGRRCELPEYIRLGSVLSQNLRKGAKGLTELLETEAEASLNERKSHARKIGEQAGTKLLLPMVLMLGIVLVILMVPAFLSF